MKLQGSCFASIYINIYRAIKIMIGWSKMGCHRKVSGCDYPYLYKNEYDCSKIKLSMIDGKGIGILFFFSQYRQKRRKKS